MTTLDSRDIIAAPGGPYEFHNTNPPNSITCLAGGTEMLRIEPDGFYVRGVKVPQDDQEALAVYKAMKEFLAWSNLTR